MLNKIYNYYKKNGFKSLAITVFNKLYAQRLSCYNSTKIYFQNKSGLEIGGPSRHFKKNGYFPVYTIAKNLDNCNFNNDTTWEGTIKQGHTFSFNKKAELGYQYILEATNLSSIESNSYDFILSSHTLEHSANPIKALYEWKRVLKDDGMLLLVLPHYKATFDHNRPVTQLNHLIEDYQNDVAEDDLTHLDEILELHDLDMDPGAGNYESFKERSKNNIENRCLHQHVFNTNSAIEIVEYIKLNPLSVEVKNNFDIFILAKK